MRPAIAILEERLSKALGEATGVACPAIVRPSTDAKFGDYQANGVMGAAKKLKRNPRELATDVVKRADLSDICEMPEIAGPGFINLRLKNSFIADSLLQISHDTRGRLGIDKVKTPQKVVVDYSGPNIAKEMHVGHMRSTILGDCIARTLEFQGHEVIRQNHIGDWGTQFGRIILGLWHVCMAEKLHPDEPPYYDVHAFIDGLSDNAKTAVFDDIVSRHTRDWIEDSKYERGDGERFFHSFLEDLPQRSRLLWPGLLKAYQYVNWLDQVFKGMHRTIETRKKDDSGQSVQESIPYESLARHITAMLQRGGQENEQERKAWEVVRELTLRECNDLYRRLRVQLTDEDVRGESFYNDRLPEIVNEFEKKGLAAESDGAVCVFAEGFKNKDGEPLPFMIRKSDGAFLYATTDLAALRYRLKDLGTQRVVYITDARQKLHFEMLFAVAKKAGWVGDGVALDHVMFGSVLGEDGKPLKTRSGENVKLAELLDEAVTRARAVVEEKNPELSGELKGRIANAVGIGAIKYADYSNNLTSDYVFSFDRMLAMEGNTAPYMQYAYARVKSIERKAVAKEVDIASELAAVTSLVIEEPTEVDLAKHLLRYGEVIASSAADYRPHYLTTYLYDLASKFSAFYYTCPVLQSDAAKRPTRLLLCDLSAQTIRHGLTELLGIEVVEQM